MAKATLEERFWAKVDRRGPDDCWPWMAAKRRYGYGWFLRNHAGGPVLAHRMAWELTSGPIPDGLLVCHHCDNPPCCNPAHLFIGTDADNTADKVAKGRQHRPTERGEQVSTAKLTEAQVIAIHARLAAGENCVSIARDFPVGQPAILAIKHGKNWPHLHPGGGPNRR